MAWQLRVGRGAWAPALVVALSSPTWLGCSAEDAGAPGGGAGGLAAQAGAGIGSAGGAAAPTAGVSGGVAGAMPVAGTPSAMAGVGAAPAAGSPAGGAGAPAAGVGGMPLAGGEPPEAGTSGAPAAGASGVAGEAGNAGQDEPPPEACDPADMTGDATPVMGVGRGAPPTGGSDVVVETDPTLEGYTVYRPEPIGSIDHPIVTWGNGGCSKNGTSFAEFLIELASHGFLVIADGAPGGSGGGSLAADGTALIAAVDWASAENERPCSKYYRKLDVTRIAVAGQSCGGLMAFGASTDERVTTSLPMNSGLFNRDQRIYSGLHAPMAIIDGGPDDIAYENGLADFNAIDTIPILFANMPVGHGGTYFSDNGGSFGRAASAWLRWWLLDDEGPTGKGMFVGGSCGLCSEADWSLMWKMEPQ